MTASARSVATASGASAPAPETEPGRTLGSRPRATVRHIEVCPRLLGNGECPRSAGEPAGDDRAVRLAALDAQAAGHHLCAVVHDPQAESLRLECRGVEARAVVLDAQPAAVAVARE